MRLAEEDLAFHRRLGRLIEQLESEDFWPAFAAFLRNHIRFDSWVVLVFRNDMPPILVHEGDKDSIEDKLFIRYLQSHYLDDPFYKFSLTQFSPGVHSLDEITHPRFRESAYFREYFRHNVVEDEMQLLTPYRDIGSSRCVFSLSVGSRHRFSPQEYGLLALISSWVLPLLSLATKNTIGEVGVSGEGWNPVSIESKLRERGEPHLTEREVQTALLLLSGQSAKGTAAHLGISPETAKVHRRNLYEKLGINSQSELFALFSGVRRA